MATVGKQSADKACLEKQFEHAKGIADPIGKHTALKDTKGNIDAFVMEERAKSIRAKCVLGVSFGVLCTVAGTAICCYVAALKKEAKHDDGDEDVEAGAHAEQTPPSNCEGNEVTG